MAWRRRYKKFRRGRRYKKFGRKGVMRARRGAPLNMRRTRRNLPRRQNICFRSLNSTDTEASVLSNYSGGNMYLLNGMDIATMAGSGTAYGNNYRTGNEIFMTGINVDFTLVNLAATGSECRVLLVYDRQPNGYAPTLATLLETSPSSSAFHYNSPLKVETMDRYQVLYDEIFALPSVATGADAHRTILMKLHHPTQYMEGANAATVADIQTGSLYLIAFESDYNTAPNADVQIEYAATLTFMNSLN